MHLSLSFWCAVLSFTKAQELTGSTSTSTNAAVPWITYTSTRSCTTQPSTVFVYTSNSTTFLLPQPGPNSALTPLDPSPVSSTGISAASDDGFTTGAEGTTGTVQASNGPSGRFLGGRGSEDSSGTPSTTTGNAQSRPWDSSSIASASTASSGDSASFVSAAASEDPSATPSNTAETAQSTSSGTSDIASTPSALSAEPSTTSRRALGAGFTAGSGPRSGAQDLSSILAASTFTPSAPYLVASGSTCPLPSTITVSATIPDASCATFEKTVTSYIMASCPAPSGVFFETQTVVQSGRTAYITNTRQITRPVVATYIDCGPGELTSNFDGARYCMRRLM
jgi:hypothetical protein